MAKYEYESLEGEAEQIRLLTLLPRSASPILRIQINITRLSKDFIPKYEALSYTWGSSNQQADILVDVESSSSGDRGDRTHSVTKNLAECLPYLQLEDKPRVLWIDAICINQQDVEERGRQVERMREIYTWASRVVVWLGPEADESSLTLRTIQDIGLHVEVDWNAETMRPADGGDVDVAWADPSRVLPLDHRALEAVEKLARRSWFERLWIWQEIRLANPASVLMCGAEVIPWRTFCNAIFCLSSKESILDDSDAARFKAILERLFNICNDHSYTRFWKVLEDTRHCKCSEPKDRIFALLGLYDIGIKPDYTEAKTYADIYGEAVKSIVMADKTLVILSLIEAPTIVTDVPSWVPDFSMPRTCNILNDNNMASGDSKCVVDFRVDGILRVTGIQAATIKSVIDVDCKHYSTAGTIALLRQIAPLDVLHASYVGGGSAFDAFCETLLTNSFSDAWSPAADRCPDREKSRNAMRDILDLARDPAMLLMELSAEARKYLRGVYNCLWGRFFFTTEEGYFGIGPRGVRSGDCVCVFLGFHNAMVLRPTDQGKYQAFGECFVSGLMEGEAFLGPMPHPYKRVERYYEGLGYWSAYRNLESGEWEIEDPRLSLLPKGWRRKSHDAEHAWSLFVNDDIGEDLGYYNPRLLVGALNERGVSLTEFDLV